MNYLIWQPIYSTSDTEEKQGWVRGYLCFFTGHIEIPTAYNWEAHDDNH